MFLLYFRRKFVSYLNSKTSQTNFDKTVQFVFNPPSTNTTDLTDGNVKFTHAEQEYVITPDVVREALHLPHVTSFAPIYPDDEIKTFIESLGYNGETSKLGRLVRAKLRKEWNFYFDCIAKCFTNKSSNFDA